MLGNARLEFYFNAFSRSVDSPALRYRINDLHKYEKYIYCTDNTVFLSLIIMPNQSSTNIFSTMIGLCCNKAT